MNSVIVSGIGCFNGIFSLQVRDGSQPYQVTPRMVVYTLQESLKEELDRLQRQHVIVH